MSRFDLASIVRRSMPFGANVASRIQAAIQAEWAAEARQGLGRSAATVSKYIAGLQPSATSNAGVELVGTFPNMFEQGLGPGGVGTEGAFDLRTTLLKATTRSIKHGKKGMYLNVPFDMSEGAITAAGGKDAMKQARKLSPTWSFPNGRTQWGGRLPPGLAEKAKPHHATDPLAGIVRREVAYSDAAAPGSQSGYRKWRTISEGGKPWIHPGFMASRIANRVMAKLDQIIAMATTPVGGP